MNTDTYLLNLANHTLDRVWAQSRDIFGARRIGKAPIILINGRLRTTCGRAFLLENKIDLSRKLFVEYTPAFIRDIIPHEVAHFVAWRRFEDCGHGTDWKNVMKALGKKPLRFYTFDQMADKS